MGRLIAYIIWMIISIILSIFMPRSRRRRRTLFRRYFYDEDGYSGRENNFNGLKIFIRRRRALAKAKPFVQVRKKSKCIILKNSNVTLIFNTQDRTFVLLDVKNTKRSASVIWNEQHPEKFYDMNPIEPEIDTEMEQTFDSICNSFNETSNYLGILGVLRSNFIRVKEIMPQEKPKKTEPETKSEKKIQKEKININSLNETELSKLPGISIIQAKKIIDRINFKGDFNSVEEFYDEMKIKSHFQKQLNDLIFAKPVERKRNNDNDDRIIDL